MNELIKKRVNKLRRKNRIKAKLINNSNLLRLSVYISNRNIFAQIIDDQNKKTLVSSNSLKLKRTNLTSMAEVIGSDIAKKAKLNKINKVVLDRNGKLYHGRIKAFAESARKEGLEI